MRSSGRSPPGFFLPRAKSIFLARITSPDARITHWRSFPSTPTKLRELCTVGLNEDYRLRHSSYLRRELCVRLAQSAAQLQCLPHEWAEKGHFRLIVDAHEYLIQALEACQCPENRAEDDHFARVLNDMFYDLKTVGQVSTMLQRLQELIGSINEEAGPVSMEVNKVLKPFFTLVTGMQFLIQHYVESRQSRRFGYSGILQLHCSPDTIARAAAQDSTSLCRRNLGRAPDIVVQGDKSATFTYVPAVLQYILAEIFKNACRAVVENHGSDPDAALPKVICNIESSPDGLVLKISDRGGGMSSKQLQRIWDFMYTTSKHSPWSCAQSKELRDTKADPKRPSQVLAGYGVGLSLSRMYAQYFGGDIVATSEEGFGTEVQIRLNRSPVCEEVLPANLLFDLPMSTCYAAEISGNVNSSFAVA